jgi:Ser/Thr protein kinase RdoA (MazF antagonist)
MTGSELRTLLEAEYGVRVKRLTSHFQHPDKSVYFAEANDDSSLVVRLYGAARPLERVEGDAAVLLRVRGGGIPAEELVPTVDGGLVAGLAGGSVLVTRRVAGTVLSRRPEELLQLGLVAGRLSRLTPFGGDPLTGRRAGSLPREDLAMAGAVLQRVNGIVPRRRRAVYDAMVDAVAATHDGEDLPRALVHPDLQPGNAVRRADGRVVLIDWDGAGLGPRLLPLGVLLFQAAIGRDPGGSWAIDLDVIGTIVEGFRRHGSATDVELARLADLVRFRPLALAARDLAASAERGEPDSPSGLWSRWADADRIGEAAAVRLSA